MSLTLPGWSRLRSSRYGLGLGGPPGTLTVAAAAFLLVAGLGAATSYLLAPPEVIGSRESDGDTLLRLNDYARSVETKEKATVATAGKLLPDVNTMIERLAARLETTPADAKGWRMLGWSYFHTGRYEQAATAYARAIELDPDSAELKSSYEEAKAKASKYVSPVTASQIAAVGDRSEGAHVDKAAKPEAMPSLGHDAAIRAMVDGLADRLERSPRDVEGWTRLMRSRVVLGEKEIAAAAFRKALDVFKDDAAASGEISAAATELGLKIE